MLAIRKNRGETFAESAISIVSRDDLSPHLFCIEKNRFGHGDSGGVVIGGTQ